MDQGERMTQYRTHARRTPLGAALHPHNNGVDAPTGQYRSGTNVWSVNGGRT